MLKGLALEALKDELLYAQQVARDEDERILVWTGAAGSAPVASSVSAETPARAPLTYMPAYLAEKILTSRSALEGVRKQVQTWPKQTLHQCGKKRL